ncbi:MAG: hypothetical protein GXO54_00450 [Chloroflexi bacterium]|nr:hypothetical protein [Chloroflexota bacterium]
MVRGDLMPALRALLGLTEEDGKRLAEYADVVRPWGETFVDALCEQLQALPETEAFLPPEKRERIKQAWLNWYNQVLEGRVDEAFLRLHERISLLHIKYHVPNGLMFSAMSRLQQMFLEHSLRTFSTDEALALYTAFKRITDLSAALIAEDYFRNALLAMERLAGVRASLMGRMLDLEIQRLLDEHQAVQPSSAAA